MKENQKISKIFYQALKSLQENQKSNNQESASSKPLSRNFNPAYFSVLNNYSSNGFNSTILCPVQSNLNSQNPTKDWAELEVVLVNEILRFTSIVALPAVLISGGSLDKSPERNLDFAYHFFTNLHPEIFFMPFSCTFRAFNTLSGLAFSLSTQEIINGLELDQINGLRLISRDDFVKLIVNKENILDSPELIDLNLDWKLDLDLRIIELE